LGWNSFIRGLIIVLKRFASPSLTAHISA
jgi:hypothetical protein